MYLSSTLVWTGCFVLFCFVLNQTLLEGLKGLCRTTDSFTAQHSVLPIFFPAPQFPECEQLWWIELGRGIYEGRKDDAFCSLTRRFAQNKAPKQLSQGQMALWC
jgi:hypothetical protein